MKKTVFLLVIFILGFLSLYSQMSSPETNDAALIAKDTALVAKDLALLQKKVNLLQIVVIVSFSINVILSGVIIYALMKKSNTK